jgi:transcriptional regulator with XRE-family HTH domain
MYTKIIMTAFTDFLLAKIQEFETKQGKRVTLDEFANHLGVSRPVLSYWLSGKTKPSLEKAILLAEKLGSEVYETLDLPPLNVDPDLKRLARIWDKIPEKKRQELAEQAEKYADNNEKKSTIPLRENT